MPSCASCEVLVINGLLCHETGCPDAWRDELRECKWCGTIFAPSESHERFCSEECAAAYNS
jgi:hypothetical protein